MTYELHLGDCLEVMKTLPDNSADAVITDPPYGTTACKWDSVIPFEPMWKELKRIAKPKAAICLFGSQPFTSALVMSNPTGFSHEWIWDKRIPSGMSYARFQPMRQHEIISVFGSSVSYYPQKTPRTIPIKKGGNKFSDTAPIANCKTGAGFDKTYWDKHPITILTFGKVRNGSTHPTQKPVDLLRYLTRTYTKQGETVLDFTMGSGTTGVACQLENRNFIGIEKDAGYFEIAKKRIEAVKQQEPLFA